MEKNVHEDEQRSNQQSDHTPKKETVSQTRMERSDTCLVLVFTTTTMRVSVFMSGT